MEAVTKLGHNLLPPKPAPKPGISVLVFVAFNFMEEY
jgi:hypothetical protein